MSHCNIIYKLGVAYIFLPVIYTFECNAACFRTVKAHPSATVLYTFYNTNGVITTSKSDKEMSKVYVSK